MKKKIYIIRHGETDYNLKRIIQGGGVNSELNEAGQSQATQFYNFYQNFPFEAVYTSALTRAQQTVASFIQKGIRHEILPGFNELNWGEFEGQSMTPELRQKLLAILQEWQQGNLDLGPKGGESPNQAIQRIRPALDYLLSKNDEQAILLCTHGRLLRILLCVLNDIPASRMDEFPIPNLSLYVFEYDTITAKINPLVFNNTDHIEVDKPPISNAAIIG